MLRTILVPLDGSALAARALPFALDLARRTGGAVHLVRAHTSITLAAASAEGALIARELVAADESLRQAARAETEATALRLSDDWGLPVTAHGGEGTPGPAIIAAADEIGADLIVMTTHGRGGFTPGWLGSVTDYVMRHSHRPVLALPERDVHGNAPLAPRSVLVTLDGSELSEAIVAPARELAYALGARVELIRIVAPYIPVDATIALAPGSADAFGVSDAAAKAKQEIDLIATRFRQGGLDVTTTVRVELSPTQALLDHIRTTDPDCLAIASQGRGLSRLVVGSVADKLLRGAGLPVLMLRPAA
jgi:nucleotide-binding universal stress UspA family protein